jgi:catecholate siderophore receptor
MPRTLRSSVGAEFANENSERNAARKITVGCLIAVASVTGAKAQSSLAPVTVDAPVERKKPVASKPSAEQVRVRNALRRAARDKQAAQARAAAATAANTAPQAPPDGDPYADPAAPYKANRLSSGKFTQPIANIPRSITVLTKDLLEDKDATSLKEVARTTPGITLGTGEGGNAFGDRFFIRGFDARNDVFVDGIRDPAVSVRENFFTEQLEILKGPSATIDGRGTTGGALNIVTKQAANANFYDAETQIASDGTRRVTLDVNQVINPTLAVRVNGMWQNAGVAGRDYTTDDRGGALAAVKWAPNDSFTVTANYVHTNLWSLPDFGVPYNNVLGAPVTSLGVPRDTYYGLVNRDFMKVQQDFGTVDSKYVLNDFITLDNKIRDEKSVLNYIGTIPEQSTKCGAAGTATSLPGLNPAGWTACLNPQTRYQVTNVVADQSSATVKFDTGPVQHELVTGVEASQEQVSIDTYSGLGSEVLGNVFSTGSIGPTSVLFPTNYITTANNPIPTGIPDVITVGNQSAYALETANYRDFLILSAGLRYDDYGVSAKKRYSTVSSSTAEISGSSGMWNCNLGAVLKPIPIASLYWAYATASDPVGSELDGTSTNYGGLNPTSPLSQVFSPIQSRAQEVGSKWELFDRRLLATIALFRTDVSNARELIGSNPGTIVEGAAYHVQGLDMGAQGNITDKWSIYTGLVLMETRVDHSATPSNVGLPLAFIAPQSFNVLTKYQINDYLNVGAQATYRSSLKGGTLLAANAGTTLPSYWRFDGFMGGKLDKNWKWKLFANNIFNKLYYDAFYQSGAPFTLVAPGRVVGIELAAKY